MEDGGWYFTEDASFNTQGSAGGKLNSKNGTYGGTGTPSTPYCTGATQTSGGISKKSADATSTYSGKFGKGGYGAYLNNVNGAGGGGGYYGGASGCGNATPYVVYSPSGGSSYISGYEGCNSITSSSTENNIVHTGNVIHYSGKYFLYSQMESGDSYMPSSSNTSQEELGHSGSGHVKITKMNME